jgi:hypothetical protein
VSLTKPVGRCEHTISMSNASDDEQVPGLPEEVVERLRNELGDRADRIIRCLRTAAVLIEQAKTDERGLQLADSAAYNLREALNAVVEGEDPAEGGLRTILDAWANCKDQLTRQDDDTGPALAELIGALNNVEIDKDRANQYARKLLTLLRNRAGIDPLTGRSDPSAEYAKLRDAAGKALHEECTFAKVTSLLVRTVAWFVRMFAPPDEIANAIRGLAAQPWQSRDQIAELERLATNDHHLRLFFSEITDPGWLNPLYEEGVVKIPTPKASWPPVAGLLSGLGRTDPHRVADLLSRMHSELKTRLPNKDDRPYARLQLLTLAVQVGAAANNLVAAVAMQQADQSGVRSISTMVAENADPADPVVTRVADAVLNHFERFTGEDSYNATILLNQLRAGATEDNLTERCQMLAAKVRQHARRPEAQHIYIGIEALTVVPDEHPEPVLLLAHHLALLLSKARDFGVPTTQRLDWLGEIPGEIGERLRSHVLTGADDVPPADKVAHIASRLASDATGDDLALVEDIQSCGPPPLDLAQWEIELGAPSPRPADDVDVVPRDWARVWRWSAVLPDAVLEGWQEQIASVSRRWGAHDPAQLTGPRSPSVFEVFGSSPYSSGQLAVMPVLEAADLVARWRPSTDNRRDFVGPLELARALESTVGSHSASWSADAVAVAEALREPLYLEHFFRGLTGKASEILANTTAVLAAAAHAWTLVTGDERAGADFAGDDYDQNGAETAILDLIRALADADADIAPSLDDLWAWALTAVREAVDLGELLYAEVGGPLTSAINRVWGHGLQTVLALAASEFRHNSVIRSTFTQTLDIVVQAPGTAGLEFRAILASGRLLLEDIAQGWLDNNADLLFRDGELGQATFDLTVKWARPTPWLYRNFKAELLDAARRGAEQAASKVVVGTLNEMDGYDPGTVIDGLSGSSGALASAAEAAVFAVQGAEPESPLLAVAVRFWALLVSGERARVSAKDLHGLGRWAFVTGLDDEEWLDLTARTLAVTDGRIKYVMSVADRAAAIEPNPVSREILLRMLDGGEPWERNHVAVKAVDMLRGSTSGPADNSFRRLRIRLIDLGYHEAGDIAAIGPDDDSLSGPA